MGRAHGWACPDFTGENMSKEVGKKKDVEDFEKGFNSGGPSLSDAWKNVKDALFGSRQSPAKPTQTPTPLLSEEEKRRREQEKNSR